MNDEHDMSDTERIHITTPFSEAVDEVNRRGQIITAALDERDAAHAELARLRGALEAYVARMDEHILNLPGWAMTCENVAIDLRAILDEEETT